MDNNPKKTKKTDLDGVKILVVDDEHSIRQMVETGVRHYGAEVMSAENGRVGLQQLMEQDYDLLVADLRMPEMDGVAFLQEVVKIWPWIHIVVITGYAEDSVLEEIKGLGINNILLKPFTFGELRNAIKEVMNEPQSTTPCASNVGLMDFHQTDEQLQYELRSLRKLTESAICAENMTDALRSLTSGFSGILPFDVVSILAREGEEYNVIIHASREVAFAFVEEVLEEIIRRYNALSGEFVQRYDMNIQREGIEYVNDAPFEVVRTVSIPIIALDEIQGIFVGAFCKDTVYPQSAVSFVYYAANQLSTVFASINTVRDVAKYDPITGIYNRLQLDTELRRIWSERTQHNGDFAVIIMDLDHFKTVNDSYGHLVGDQVLHEFAQLLKNNLKPEYVLGRYGGEEFVVLLPNTSEMDARDVAQKIIKRVRDYVFCTESNPLTITISAGIAAIEHDDKKITDCQQLLSRADNAMYYAKRAGRNCCRTFMAISTVNSQRKDSRTVEIFHEVNGDRTKGKRANLMVVDDDDTIVQLLRRVLEEENYNVESVNSSVEALGILNERSHEFDIVLVDLMMPGITGIHLLQRIKELDETLIPIIITGNATIDNAVDSLRCGAYDFIQKPFQIKYVYAVVERALEYRRTLVENVQYEHQLLEMVQERSARISENLRELKESYRFTLEALVGMLDIRERYSGVHSKRVRDFTVVLANEYDLTSDQVDDIAHGALLHDLGKIGIPDSILQKRSPLEPSEWEIMKRHPEIGYSILKNSSFLKEAAEMVYSHHEWYDGTGYPRGLKGKEICLGARIFSLADAYDAMRTNRSYRKSIPLEDVVREIRTGSGTQFDPRVVRVFLAKVDELERILHRMLENYTDENE